MPATTSPGLSKSSYLAGWQCSKRLWLAHHEPALAAPLDATALARMADGTAIGRAAQRLFPGGVIVPSSGDPAAATTRLLADPAVPAIFEAAFEYAGVRVRVDVLERLHDATWGLREVKSGTGVGAVHLQDVALQRFVLEGAGLAVSSVEVIHLDPAYVRDAGAPEWSRLFRRRDVTQRSAAEMGPVAARVAALHAVLGTREAPAVEPSRHCGRPHDCSFWEHCTASKPEDWLYWLPGRHERLAPLREAGVERIADLPDDAPLSALQARVRDVVRTGLPFVGADLGRALARFGPPAVYLDFETMNPAVPLYEGTRPYQQIPFQWSLHRVDARGAVTHAEFLANGRDDPRPALAASLLEALGGEPIPVVVYSSFEARVLADLGETLPRDAAPLGGLRSRLADLLPVVRQHVYHPRFRGSFSIKAVGPALVPGLGYEDLTEVADGGAASAAFLEIVRCADAPDAAREARLRAALLAYCARDTLVLLELHRALHRLANATAS